jgi:O-glycosyl hydrolase
MLKNGNTRGGDNGKENLRPDTHAAFAEWLVKIAGKFRQEYGISFQTIEPFNEPSAWWWKGESSNQEGCYITWPEQAGIIQAMLKAIKADGGACRIACSDENGAEQAINTLNWMTTPVSNKGGGLDGKAIYRLNVHAYNGWDWQDRLRELAKQRGVGKIWMSEVSNRESENAGFVPNDMRCALPNTRSLISDIKRLQCSAWVYWQPVEPLQYGLSYHYTYGLLPAAVDRNVDWNGKTYHPGEFVVTKTFYALKQFTTFIRPNYRLVRSGEFWTLAALSPDSRKLVLVVHNDEKKSKHYTFDLTSFKTAGKTAQVWQTRDDDVEEAYNCRAMASHTITQRTFSDTIPARSVTTYVVNVTL